MPKRAGPTSGADRATSSGGNGSVVQLTATSRGWYVNRCTNGHEGTQPVFSPEPWLGPTGRPAAAPELHTLLCQLSPAFAALWGQALSCAAAKARAHESPLEMLALMVSEGRMDTAILRPQWCVPHSPLPLVCNTPLRYGGSGGGGEDDRDSSSSSDDVDHGQGKVNGHVNGVHGATEPVPPRSDQVSGGRGGGKGGWVGGEAENRY